MSDIPPDFGGFLAYWDADRAVLIRVGEGKAQEGMRFTPLNLLQARKTLDELIAEGQRSGMVTEEHLRQSGMLPTSRGIADVMPRADVDKIAGDE